MSQQLSSINLVAPAFKGVNTEDSPIAQDPSFAEVADNAVIDKRGRIAARKGYDVITTDKTELGSSKIRTIREFRDSGGNTEVFSVGNNKILSGTTTLVDETPATYSITTDNWKIVNFNDKAYFFQRGYEPLVYDNAGGSVVKLSTVSGAAGVTSAMYGNEVLSAYGRLWTADFSSDKSTIYWSDLLIGHDWSGGTSGSIDISKVWPDGYDEIVALAAHNGLLVIFGQHSIVVYQGAEAPATMSLSDTVAGVGCVDRDTVQHTGTDVLFLSHTGLRSFGRTIQQKSMPLQTLSKTITKDLISLIQNESSFYRSVYSPEENFYLLTFVGQSTTFCFDLRGALEDGSLRVTRWPSSVFSAYERTQSGTLYVGSDQGISEYKDYQDNGESYRFKYYSPSLTFGDASKLKFIKKIKPTIVGASGEIASIKFAYDFDETYRSVAGIAGSLFIPGAALAKLSQGASTARRVTQAAGLGAAEGAAYGFLAGEGEERLESAAIGAGVGGVLGGAAGRFLTKGTGEIVDDFSRPVSEALDKPVDIGGAQGFVNRGRASSGTGDLDPSTHQRKATDVVDDDDFIPDSIHENPEKGSRVAGSLFMGTREWVEKNVGIRAARLVEDSETMARTEYDKVDEIFNGEEFSKFAEMFENSPGLKGLFLRINQNIKKESRVNFSQARSIARTPEEKALIDKLEIESKVLREYDFVPFGKPEDDYFPTINIAGSSGTTKVSDYDNPIEALRRMAKDVSVANAVARRFNLDMSKYEDEARKLIVENAKPMSRLEFVIKKVRDEARAQAAKQGNVSDPSAVADNLRDALRSVLISSKSGGDAVGAVARRSISAALLANPMNAVLNIIEGFTSPVYQNGLIPFLKTVPKAILATFNKEFGQEAGRKWISNKQLGLDNYMGEVQNAAKKTLDDSLDTARYARLPAVFGRLVDKVGEAAYTLSGVRTVNRMGQEILTNSSVRRGIDLAKKGDPKSLEKLKKHPGMRGLSPTEFKATVEALKKEDLTNGWVTNFAGASLNKWQPVSASAMPRAYNDNPNFRVMYSMLSYMNRQANNLRTEVGLNIMKAKDKGLNTKEGAEAAKAAMLNSAKYTALFGVIAGIWDDARKTMDFSNDKYLEDLMTPEGIASATMNQLASNMTSGIVNIRAQEYGGDPISVTPPPLAAAAKVSTGVSRLLTEGDVDPLLKATQTYTPGVATIDRIVRMTPVIQDQLGRGRLFTD